MNALKQLNAFGFEMPSKCNTSYGNWVVYFKREGFSRIVDEKAYFWTKKKATAFYAANTQ